MVLAAGKGKSKARDPRRSRSRNTTPNSTTALSSASHTTTTAYLGISIASLNPSTDLSYDSILEKHGSGSGIPDPKLLENLVNDLRKLSDAAETRGQACNRGMRETVEKQKEQLDLASSERKLHELREAELAKAKARKLLILKKDSDSITRKQSKVKRRDDSRTREEQPSTHGAHTAHEFGGQDWAEEDAQDASDSAEHLRPYKKVNNTSSQSKREGGSVNLSSSSPSSQLLSPKNAAAPEDIELDSPASSASSILSHQPPPAAAAPNFQTFGPDPSVFPDPTIYHIKEIDPSMSEDEKKKIYSVTSYPLDDLHGLIPGTPPDKDFSNAKPSNQVGANTFATYIEPYFRPFTDEDLAFLRERGDRTAPFVVPRRGARHYSEAWADEDGAMLIDSLHAGHDRLPPNQPRGSIEQINDDIAETDQISGGPMLSRILAAMRPENRVLQAEEKPAANGANGPDTPTNIVTADLSGDLDVNAEEKPAPLPPATFFPESMQPGWKISSSKPDYNLVDERLKQELRHIGFLADDSEPDYEAYYDDEVAARLRVLQSKLKEQSIINGARKARITELAKERLALQEYSTILDDLDNQTQQAYLKRTRTIGKSKKQKRPGGAGGGSHYVSGPPGQGIMRPGIGDVAKQLMERRRQWIDSIGPVFESTTGRVPKESIFQGDVMKELMEKERDAWDELDDLDM
ncbi:MAG: Transcriptional regulator [Trizodia sp. TS-e1964]|nr:MAG: Transcriptional regulator [Trizodia sp. TS-e1964]